MTEIFLLSGDIAYDGFVVPQPETALITLSRVFHRVCKRLPRVSSSFREFRRVGTRLQQQSSSVCVLFCEFRRVRTSYHELR